MRKEIKSICIDEYENCNGEVIRVFEVYYDNGTKSIEEVNFG